MATITSIDGSSWPTSGSATAGTTGLDAVVGGTHVGSADLPTGSTATGYIQGTDGGQLYIQIDDTASIPTTGDYWWSCWIYAERTSGTVETGEVRFLSMTSSGTKFTGSMFWQEDEQAFTSYVTEFLTGGSDCELAGVGASSGEPTLPTGEWVKLTLHFKFDASDARLGLYLNGMLVSENSGVDTTGLSFTDADFRIDLKARTGIRWRISGDIESDDGAAYNLRPDWSLNAGRSVTQPLIHHESDDSTYKQGRMFDLGGSATLTPTLYSTSGVTPLDARVVVGGSSSQTATIDTIDDIGTLPYRTRDGWSTVVIRDLLIAGGATGTIKLRNAADDGDLISLDIDSSGNLKEGSDTLETLSASKRYQVAIHLNSDGSSAYTVVDLTGDFLSSGIASSGDLDGWTPASIGKAKVALTLGSADCEVGGINVCETWDVAVFDSLVEADANGVSPALATHNNVANKFTAWNQTASVPGGFVSQQYAWAASTHSPRSISCVVGRSGRSREQFADNALAGFSGTRGARMWVIDGGSVNDTGVGTAPIASQAAADAIVADLNADMTTIWQSWVRDSGNDLWLTTMSLRPNLTNSNAFFESLVEQNNANLLASARAAAAFGVVEFSDTTGVDASTAFPNDDVHPSGDGSNLIAEAMIGEMLSQAGGALDPSILKYGMILDDSTLKPGLVNETYTSGTGTSDTLKPGVLDSEGNIKPGLLDADGNIKPGALR